MPPDGRASCKPGITRHVVGHGGCLTGDACTVDCMKDAPVFERVSAAASFVSWACAVPAIRALKWPILCSVAGWRECSFASEAH